MRLKLLSVGLVVAMTVGCADDRPPSPGTLCETQYASPNFCTSTCAGAMRTAGATECADETAALVTSTEYVTFRTCLDECAIVRDCMGVGAGILECNCLVRCAGAQSRELQNALTANMLCFERATATECL